MKTPNFIDNLRFKIEYLRIASNFYSNDIFIMAERHAAQAPALRERLPKIFIIQ